MVEAIRCDDLTIPTTILAIAHTSLLTSSPLKRWQFASQVILEKGKGRFIEHLGIVQLCEADLNFVLHVIWGKHLMHHAISNYGLDTAQYAIPGQMCNNAILNKLLFLDLSWQTLSPGIMMEYDAKAAYDRVLRHVNNLGYQGKVGFFMYNLLHEMSPFTWSHWSRGSSGQQFGSPNLHF